MRARPGPTEAAGILEELAARLAETAADGEDGLPAALDAPFGALTTYRVGGTAGLMVDVQSEAGLRRLHEAMAACGAPGRVPVLVLGKGSNLLVADAGFPGVVVRPRDRLEDIEVRVRPGGRAVRAGGAAGLPVVARRSVEAGLAGLEWAVGVPGSVGGAVKMNAGGHGSDTAACLLACRLVDLGGGGVREEAPDGLHLGYRTSSLRDTEVVVWADLAAAEGDVEAGRRSLAEIVAWRREHQPGGKNAGSVFTNPPGDAAGRLVEAAGLKGFRLRSARVSEKHANFIQADEGGSADDVLALMAHVRATVLEASGVVLRPEVRLVGFGDAPLEGVAT